MSNPVDVGENRWGGLPVAVPEPDTLSPVQQASCDKAKPFHDFDYVD